ncbi:AP-3 complex subunit mu-1 [Fulvia fulva]|uniref:AP-3 complex subunit mu-1 n=1 Tax=Passalora fulva TaxID=5499 RepID=A0A9Q8LFL9_PASFU|nr:AP-3 complex subunit mu-1 [Fulvia fulva]KAK4626722.1 AP-3 complex subunit mu-1 [Fulvia fulva]KAK4627769.1 AP-3 complex subunit mu-1 [Fulvia fulva]UJO16510.1 AP-3 complex subunit mu-1 [Fulvia fulva]WPV13519.1 AP-3 complex subunit mu-1 [Fulvia fulva]WPV28675.1 AP-3 complex subunit mu-1 [Fulvia fulva]
MSAIEALYIFDEHNSLLFNHVYTGRPPPPSTLLPLYLQHAAPRPSVQYVTSTSPPTILFSVIQDNLLFLSPSSSDIEPLLVLEFLHRVADALEEFLSSPLLATKISANYDIVAQIAAEMADSGVVCQGEANALRDVVETGPGVLNNLLGKIGVPGSSPALQAGGPAGLPRPNLTPSQTSVGSAIPWRRTNVRHTSNELYVDIVESLAVTLAPSGRPLSAFAHGSVAFTSKVSGVPDLLLSLSTGGKGAGMGNRGDQLRNVMERIVFHPCVRLSTWKKDGVLSFVPPDGRFALCGYEADLLGPDMDFTTSNSSSSNLNLPVNIEIITGLGPSGTEFEVRARPDPNNRSAAAASLQSNLSTGMGTGRPGSFKPAPSGDSKAPALEDLTIHIPIPSTVRNVSEMRPTRGEANWNPAEGSIEWRIPPRDFGPGGAVLRCTVQGPLADEDADLSRGVVNGMTSTTYGYDEDTPTAYQNAKEGVPNGSSTDVSATRSRELMPTCVTLSFSVKGWLASGLKVESLLLDMKKSRGLGPEVKPYKGVKYLTVSRQGVELRC